MLTETQYVQFQEQGYLVVNDVIDESTILAVYVEYADLLEKLCNEWQSQGLVTPSDRKLSFWEKLDRCREAGIDWFQYFDISLPHEDIRIDTPMHFGPAVFNLVTHRNILGIVEKLIGPEITSNPIQHVRIKPPQNVLPEAEVRAHITATDWHQDRGVGHAEADETDMITVWIAMTDATPENGCLQVLPNVPSELLPHCPQKQTAIADGFIQTERAIPIPVKRGGIVLLHPLTPHSSLSNKTDGYRWSFDLRYNVTGQPTGRSQFPEFIARSRSNPTLELKDWRKWQESWEEARAHLSQVPHIPQHRWQGEAPYCA